MLEEPDGEETDVAVKLLRDEDVASITLKRFRDEAELLARVRDRAIVRVEPPVKLADAAGGGAGKWALVMDLVTGSSLQRLTSLGAMPPSVATEIVGEVARTLEKAWRATGPDGQRLRILHRDVKPSNLQLSVAGVIRVLDFGIAKADYKTRDAQVTTYGTGTRGYIAPERLEGTESPAGDIFSLGVTAHALIGGDRPPRKRDNEPPEVAEVEQAMIALFTRMRSPVSADRPAAIDVEEECTRLRAQSDGMTLREWAERNVPRAIALTFSDEVVGTVLVETQPGTRSTRAPASRAPSSESRAPGLSRMAAPPSQLKDDDEVTVVASRESYLTSLESEPTPLPLPPGRTNPPFPIGRTNPPVPAPGRNPPSAAPRPMPRAAQSVPPPSDLDAAPTPLPLPPGRTNPPAASPRPMARAAQSVPPPAPTRAAKSQPPASLPREFPPVPPSPDLTMPLPPAASMAATPVMAPPPEARPGSEDHEARGGLRWFIGVLAMAALVMAGGMVIGVAGGAGVWWLWPAPMALRHNPTGLPPPNTEPLTLDGVEIEPPIPPKPRTLTFSSVPLGADVYVDRVPVGQTPVTGLEISEGTHEVILVSDFERLVRPIEVGKKKPVRYVWKGGSNWELHF